MVRFSKFSVQIEQHVGGKKALQTTGRLHMVRIKAKVLRSIDLLRVQCRIAKVQVTKTYTFCFPLNSHKLILGKFYSPRCIMSISARPAFFKLVLPSLFD